MISKVIQEDCKKFLAGYDGEQFDLSFLDPPFNQAKDYRNHNDNLSPEEYWDWMTNICSGIFQNSSHGAAIYFMQREKNTKHVLEALNSTGWTFQNLIIWKKKTSAVPSNYRFGKHFQIIVFATKGSKPRVFNKLRIDPPLLETEKYRRPNGMFVTDVWNDIRELTSGYFAGEEPLRYETGERVHKQQSPIHLLARIVLSSTNIGDTVFDPFAGTGTTMIVSKQLQRDSLGIEIDSINVEFIEDRLANFRSSDDLTINRDYYRFTKDLESIWPIQEKPDPKFQKSDQLHLFKSP